ncbi:MAG: HAMP domain-containing sensor histidine kinase [Myxococcales bacterium]
MVAPADLARPEQWRQQYLLEAERRWVHSRTSLALIAAIAVFALMLVFLGFALWRSALAVVIAATFALIIVALRRETPRAIRAFRWFFPVAFATLGAGIVVTGGVHSPLMVLVLCFPGLLVLRGFSRATQFNLLIVALSMLAAVLAGPLIGPVVPEPWFSLFTAVFFVLGLALSVSHVTTISRTLDSSTRELLWARDKAAEEVSARARELELISSRLSHELKNPLAAIKGLVQVTLRSTADADTRERLSVVDSEIDRMNGILQDYLTFARPLAPPSLAPVQLETLVDEVLSVLEARAGECGVKLSRTGAARASVDERRLRQALVNLVDNAVDACASGGEIVVSLATRDGKAVVAVKDNGQGMSAEVLARLGTPFFTTRERGNGLGVMVARGIFRQHGGALEFTSEPGRGTTATGTLPAGGRGAV